MKKENKLIIYCIFFFLYFFCLISAVSITDVSSSPEEVAPGQIIEISIEIENIFEETVYELNVKLDLSEEVPFAPYQSSSERFLNELDEGDEEKFNFELIALPSTRSGVYKIPVEIRYKDSEGNYSSKKELISLTINSKPELKVSLTDSVVLIKGKENTILIKLINSGLADVKFVYLITSDSKGIKFLSEKEQYLGDIDTDDFDSVRYSAYIDAEAPTLITLPIILKFKDATNKEFIENKNLDLKTYTLKEAQNLGLVKKPNYMIFLIIAFLVFGYIFYRIRKRRKLRKK